jgi:NMD protein affecting ribosome stability and mRNA decay
MNTLTMCRHCGRIKINGKWMRFKFTGGPSEIEFLSGECDSCKRVSELLTVFPKEAA